MKRDLVGYGKNPPRVEWPGGCQIAVSLVINYEEGSDLTPVYGERTRDQRRNTVAQAARSAQSADGNPVGIWWASRRLATVAPVRAVPSQSDLLRLCHGVGTKPAPRP